MSARAEEVRIARRATALIGPLATGGSVFSTTEARRLIACYGTLGQLLGNRAVTFAATVAVCPTKNAPSLGLFNYFAAMASAESDYNPVRRTC